MEKEKLNEFFLIAKKAFEEVSIELLSCEFLYCQKFMLEGLYKTAIIIGISGSSVGRILLECDLETSIKIALTMNFGDRLDDPNDVYIYMAEFANMIGGRTTTYINNQFKDQEVRLVPPTFFSGKRLEILTPAIQANRIYYNTNLGKFIMEIGFEGTK